MGAAWVKTRVGPISRNIRLIRQITVGNSVQKALVCHDRNHVVARYGHVIGAHAARLERGQHRLV